MTKEVVINQVKFLKFNFKTDRFDSFLYQFVAINVDYSDSWKVMKLIFIPNHGQSFNEWGFIINKLTSDVNMEEESLIAQRVIYDAMNSVNADAGSFSISKKLNRAVRKPVRDKLAQAIKKSDLQKSEKEQKRKLKEEEVKQMKRQKLDVEQTIETLKKSLCEEAIVSAQQNGRDYATKVASSAKTLKEKEVLYHELCGLEKRL